MLKITLQLPEPRQIRLTQDLKPPARPTAYPVRNSFELAPEAVVPVGDLATSLDEALLLLLLLLLNRAGL
jgi:hypothetical protein